MVTLAGISGIVVGAVVVWFVAAFLLRWRHDARCAATILIPAAIVTTIALHSFFGYRGFPADDRGWSVVLAIISLLAGAFAGVVALPVWLVVEERFGGRAR